MPALTLRKARSAVRKRKQSMQSSSSSVLVGQKRKRSAMDSGSEVPLPASVEAIFPGESILRRTAKEAKQKYLAKRSNACDGRTVRDVLTSFTYADSTGSKAKYKFSDLKYDIKCKLLEVKAPKGAKQTKARSLPPLRSVKRPQVAKSLRDGIKLRSGAVMPVVGYGTYKLKKGEAAQPIQEALKAGYRLIDTAQIYENEGDVGVALSKSGLRREDVFIETKVWRSSHGYDRTMKAFQRSLKNLGTSYIDLYVIHWPGAKTGWPLPRGAVSPPDWTPKMRDTGTWRAMEDLYEQGKIKAIGVTNYSLRHLQQLLKSCRIKPMVNQVEFHPRLVQTKLLEFCKKKGIAVQAYASLGSGDAAQAEDFFAFPAVAAAARAHKVTPAQVLLRWALEKGCHVVPKSTKQKRIEENAEIFSFKLTTKEVAAIDKLHTGTRFAWKGLDPDTVK